MLIDLHCHTKGISKCSKVDYKQLIDISKKYGLDGIVLTNHLTSISSKGEDKNEFAKRYIQEYLDAKKYGDSIGFKVFFGVEVTLENENWEHVLIYGVEPEFVLRYPTLYEYKIEQIYKIVKDNNALLIQAHPFRLKNCLLDVKYLDGVELNCHFQFEGPHFEEVIKVYEENKMILTSGSDYHGDTLTRPIVGLKADVNSMDDIIKILLRKDYCLLVQNQEDEESFEYKVGN